MNSGMTDRHTSHLYRVCWESVVGRCGGRGAPMSRETAEFVAYDEALANSMYRFWVEACASSDADGETNDRPMQS